MSDAVHCPMLSEVLDILERLHLDCCCTPRTLDDVSARSKAREVLEKHGRIKPCE